MASESFEPGNRVIWTKRGQGGRSATTMPGTVLGSTAKRVQIEVEDSETGAKVVRHVAPASLRHHGTTTVAAREPSSGSRNPKTGERLGPKREAPRRTPDKDEEREERIHMEIVVDAYGPEEQAMGWYYYLDDNLAMPFEARCVRERSVSPLAVGDQVRVVAMAPEDECEREMFVAIEWGKRTLAIPLAQLELIEDDDTDDATWQAIGDWHYWVDRGYQLG